MGRSRVLRRSEHGALVIDFLAEVTQGGDESALDSSSSGRPPLMASMFTPKLSAAGVA